MIVKLKISLSTIGDKQIYEYKFWDIGRVEEGTHFGPEGLHGVDIKMKLI